MNCRYLSLLFTQILLSLNFRARWVKCLPVEIISKETHCVTEVYIEELKKWIVVDAPYGLIYFNKSGIPLNLIEMRQNIVSGKMFRFFSDSKESIELIYRNWINHIFRFQYSLYNDYDMFKRKKQRFAILNPMNFLSYDELNNQNKFNFFQFDNCEFFLNR